jgi:Rieske Fe-S protein
MAMAGHRKVVLPFSSRLVSFYKDYLVINKKQKIIVLSAHCSHLGCTINKVEGEKLVCPCHGSEFNLNGEAVKGPAYKPLKSYAYKESADKQQIIVQTGEV